MIGQRAEALAGRLAQPGTRGVADVSQFLLLQALNRWQPLLAHWADAGNVHPEEFYATLVQVAGELATFTDPGRRGSAYPGYRHEDLQRSFAPVIADLRRALSADIDQNAVAIPLRDARHGVRIGPITDRNWLRAGSFVLSVQAEMPSEHLRRLFPNQVKIGAVEHIRELVNVALPGIAVRPLPVAPRQIPFHAGATYFELDRGSPHWQQMQTSGGFAIHVSGEFPDLRMELWAILATSDNPFAEPEDSDRTVVRGPARAASPMPAAAPAAPPQPMPAGLQAPPRMAGEAETLPRVGLSPARRRRGAAVRPAQPAGRIRAPSMWRTPRNCANAPPRPARLRGRARAPVITPDEIRAAHYALCAASTTSRLRPPGANKRLGRRARWSPPSIRKCAAANASSTC